MKIEQARKIRLTHPSIETVLMISRPLSGCVIATASLSNHLTYSTFHSYTNEKLD